MARYSTGPRYTGHPASSSSSSSSSVACPYWSVAVRNKVLTVSWILHVLDATMLYRPIPYWQVLSYFQHFESKSVLVVLELFCSTYNRLLVLYRGSEDDGGPFYTPKPPPLATEPNYFLQAEKPPKNLWLSRKVILRHAAGKKSVWLVWTSICVTCEKVTKEIHTIKINESAFSIIFAENKNRNLK